MNTSEYQKYRWFITSTGKLVVGGKSAVQNDGLLIDLKSKGKNYAVLHTAIPGSPFAVILDDIDGVNRADLKEVAVFTASFSRAWRSGMKKAIVHLFTLKQVYKDRSMKAGTWGVKGKVEKLVAHLGLVLTVQNNKLRAVPPVTVKGSNDVLLECLPGPILKEKMITKIQNKLAGFSDDQILSALPAGGVRIKAK